MSLTDFLEQRGIQRQPVGQTVSTGSLSSFLGQKGISAPAPEISIFKEIVKEPEEKKSKIKSAFRWLGKQLSKPHGIATKAIRGTGEIIGNLMSIASPKVSAGEGVKAAAKSYLEAQKGAFNVLRGKEETTLLKEMESAGIETTKFDKVMGLGGEIMLDPLWVIKPVKITKKIGEITKLEKPVKTLANVLKETDTAKRIKTLFSNTTTNKEFDAIVKKFRNLRDYREANLIDDAVKLQKDIKTLGKGAEEIITEGLENPNSLKNVTDIKIVNIVNNLKNTYSDLLQQSRKVGLSVGEIEHYAPHIRTKESFIKTLKENFGLGAREFGKGAIEKSRKLKGTIKELTEQGIDIFEKNPAIQLAKKGQAYAKAITSAEFANDVKKFAIKGGTEVTNPLLKGMKFEPDVAAVIDNFYQGIKPKELNVALKSFDKIQNIWKAQALISPSYHIRNFAGNLWNNFLAGINPAFYGKAGLLQRGLLKEPKLIEKMRKLGVIDEGWYAKDIGEEVLNRVKGVGNWKAGINPVNQQNYLFQLNKKIGKGIENNARMAHYLSKISEGLSPEKAAESVKKYLFDYGDLTDFEKNIMKRAIPFYTWTRKNLPLQLESLITQPAKFALPHKIITELESGTEVPNEKYMSPYITENVPVRIRKNEKGNTEYFLLGNWLPYASAIDVLSQPLETFIGMATPIGKTPFEYLFNKSTYFKNTLGEYSDIESRFKQQGEFLGASLRKKNILLLRNIRILNDIDKWIDKQDPTATKNSFMVKLFNTLFGRAATYDIGKSKYFYDQDTEDRISDLKKAIKDAQKRGFNEKATELHQELIDFQRIRAGD